jgi:PAS domain S-box-containing protein
VLDSNNRFLAVNDTLCSWLERSRADLLDHTFIDLMPLDDHQRQETYRIYREMIQLETEPMLTIWPVATTSGQVRQLQAQGSLFRDEQGQMCCVVVSHLVKKPIDGADEMHYRSLIERQNQFLVTRWLPTDGTLTFVNQAYAAFFGMSREALIGRKVSDLLGDEAAKDFNAYLLQLKDAPKAFVRRAYYHNADGEGRWLRWVNDPIFDDRGRVRFFQGMGVDISDQVARENELATQEAHFRLLTENMADVVAMHNLDGTYTYLSPSVETVLGYRPEALLGQSPYDYFHPDDCERIRRESHEHLLASKQAHKITYRYRHQAGHYVWFETQALPVTNQAGKVIALQTVSRDVSALKYSEDAYETLVNNALQGFVLLQDDRIVFANPRAEDVLGYPLEVLQDMTPETYNQLIHPDDLSGVLETLDNIASGRQQTTHYTTRIIRPDGEMFWLEFSTTVGSYRGKPALQTAFIDISDKVNTEHALAKSESRYREIVEVGVGSVYSFFCCPPEGGASEPLVSQDDWYWVRDWEPPTTTLQLTGYTLAEIDALGGYPLLVVSEDRAAFEASRRHLQAGDVRTTEYRITHKAGTVLWVEDFIKVVIDSYQARPCLRVYGSNRDISERKQVEGILQAALDEKDIMLKEIHHRVKNNMQVISSLLALQSHEIDDVRARQAFADSRQRILAMAEVHKKIYESPDLAGIDFLNYLGYLVRTFAATQREVYVPVTLEGDPVKLGVEQAVPLGLIASELLSNIYKHAFPAGRIAEPMVQVHLGLEPSPPQPQQGQPEGQPEGQQTGQHVTLTIADNGVGVPETLQAQRDSLGMTIVQALVDQLDGQVMFTRGIAAAGVAIRVQCLWLAPPTKTDTSQFFISHTSQLADRQPN